MAILAAIPAAGALIVAVFSLLEKEKIEKRKIPALERRDKGEKADTVRLVALFAISLGGRNYVGAYAASTCSKGNNFSSAREACAG